MSEATQPPAFAPGGTQTIGAGDAEALNVHDTGGVPEATAADDVAGPDPPAQIAETPQGTTPDPEPDGDLVFDPATGLFEDIEPIESEGEAPESEPGATEPDRGTAQTAAPETAAAPADTTRPDWIPAEIDHTALSEQEMLRLRLVQQQAVAANQPAADEQALLQRFREAKQSAAPCQPAAAPAPQQYQPRQIDVPEGYEGDAAITSMVAAANQQAAENAYLYNQNAQAIHGLQAQQATTAQQAEQSSQLAEWNAFVAQHPEAADAEVQQRMGDDIRFWRGNDTTLSQMWAAALKGNLPAATPPSTAPMDPRERVNRGRRAAAANAANAAPAARQPEARETDLSDLHERGASFAEFHNRLHG